MSEFPTGCRLGTVPATVLVLKQNGVIEMLKPYLVWADFETKACAEAITAALPRDAALYWMRQRDFLAGELSDSQELVTVLEDCEGAIEESYDVFCRIAYSASKRVQDSANKVQA